MNTADTFRPMRILYVGNTGGFSNLDKYYFIPEKLINGFTRLGHNVVSFNDRDIARYANIFRSQKRGKNAMNEKLVDLCKEYKPEFIVLGHCKAVTNDTLGEIRDILPDAKIIYRNVDPLNSENNKSDIQQRVGHVEAIFITTAGEALKQFSHPKTKVSFFPNPVDPAVESVCSFKNPDADIDLIMLGSPLRDQYDHRKDTINALKKRCSDIKLHLGGIVEDYPKVFGAGFFELLNRSKTGLCMNKTADYYLYSSARMSQYMASGVMAFIPEGPQFEDIFGDDSFVSVKNDDDLVEKVHYYATNDNERRKIAETGYTKIRDFFLIDKVCQYMIDVAFDRPLSQDYKWPTTLY